MRTAHLVRASGVALGLGLAATGAGAQELRDLVLAWAVGDYRAPLTCTVDGVPRQALRRVTIALLPPRTARPGVRVTFFDLEAPPGTRCTGVAGAEELNLAGQLDLVFDGRSRPDTGAVDFRNALRRDRGFDFKIERGRLRIASTAGDAEPRLADFRRGDARLEVALAGSDSGRHLAALGGSRNRVLRVAAEGGPTFAFDLTELPER